MDSSTNYPIPLCNKRALTNYLSSAQKFCCAALVSEAVDIPVVSSICARATSDFVSVEVAQGVAVGVGVGDGVAPLRSNSEGDCVNAPNSGLPKRLIRGVDRRRAKLDAGDLRAGRARGAVLGEHLVIRRRIRSEGGESNKREEQHVTGVSRQHTGRHNRLSAQSGEEHTCTRKQNAQ